MCEGAKLDGKTDEEEGKAPQRQITFSPFFSSAYHVIQKGNKHALQPSDLLAQGPAEDVGRINEVFEASWKEEVAAELAAAANPPPPPKKPGQKPKKLKKASLFVALKPICIQLIRRSGVLYGLGAACQFAGPLILSRVLLLLEDIETCEVRIAARLSDDNGTLLPAHGLATDAVPESCLRQIGWGYALAGAILLVKFCESLLTTHTQFMMFKMVRKRHTT